MHAHELTGARSTKWRERDWNNCRGKNIRYREEPTGEIKFRGGQEEARLRSVLRPHLPSNRTVFVIYFRCLRTAL